MECMRRETDLLIAKARDEAITEARTAHLTRPKNALLIDSLNLDPAAYAHHAQNLKPSDINVPDVGPMIAHGAALMLKRQIKQEEVEIVLPPSRQGSKTPTARRVESELSYLTNPGNLGPAITTHPSPPTVHMTSPTNGGVAASIHNPSNHPTPARASPPVIPASRQSSVDYDGVLAATGGDVLADQQLKVENPTKDADVEKMADMAFPDMAKLIEAAMGKLLHPIITRLDRIEANNPAHKKRRVGGMTPSQPRRLGPTHALMPS
ncbi:hypothetical protein BC834DRAFT_992258 [Gloeopeniophorella convolvens]|nr:hypothetical protein BC834DRAFT_992258 [Gloeopeniophorella convolvens]